MDKIGFIGTGVMGEPMAGHLLNAGYSLTVYTRSKDKASSLIRSGAQWTDTPGDAAAVSDIVITMVGYPQDVEEIYLGKNGILERSSPGTLLIDCTTSSPKLARILHEKAGQKNCAVLDAPVSGGPMGAQGASLAIMVGGNQDVFDRALPVLQKLGKNIALQGGPGAGQLTKMANQIAVAGSLLGTIEALIFSRKAGLDVNRVHNLISKGAAASFSLDYGEKLLQKDYRAGFYAKHFLKDLKIALKSAEEMGTDFPMLSAAKSVFEKMVDSGMGDDGVQGAFKLY